MKQNNMISFWRIIFTYSIILLHIFNQYSFTTGWAIGVEFFFVVSGWLLANDVDTKAREPYAYTLYRLKRLYPEYIPAFILSAFCFIYFNQYNAKEAVNWIATNGLREILMIHYWPWEESYLIANDVTWYISVIILAGLLLYSCLKRIPKFTKEVLLPIIIVTFLTYSYRTSGSLTGDVIDGMFYHHRFICGLAEMGIGCLLYELNTIIAPYLRSTFVRIIGFLILTIEVVISFFWWGKYDYLFLFLISIGVLISFNMPLLKCKRVITFFDKISYSLFLNHYVFRRYFIPHFYASLTFEAIIIYIIGVTIYSIAIHFVVVYWFTPMIKRFIPKLFPKKAE